MFRKTACAVGFLLVTQIGSSAASSDEQPYYLIPSAQADMEKCFALPDARSKECVAAPDSDDCAVSEKQAKDGTEFKYVPLGSCVKQGGKKVMEKRPKPQK